MRLFLTHQIREAIAYANEHPLNSALHLHRIVFPNSPECFKRDVRLGLPIAHLFSTDLYFLREIAARHGVKRVFIDKQNTPRQHIDLCGRPLREVLEEMGEDINDYAK